MIRTPLTLSPISTLAWAIGMADAAGPGWYESSRDLRGGLDICEGTPRDPWADADLDQWIGACLRQRGLRSSTALAATRFATACLTDSPSSMTASA